MSISPIGIIPEALLFPDKKDQVIAFLAELPGPPRRRKEIYVGWCTMVGVVLTEEDIEEILGPFTERARG